jgi:hypothetical protein
VAVAISINLSRILEFPHLPARAGAALVPLASVLVVALLGLVPAQPVATFGLEILAVGLLMWLSALAVAFRVRTQTERVPPWRSWANLALSHAQSLAFVVAGVLLATHNSAGAYWLAPGVVLSLIGGLASTWVLLVEIVR